MDQLPVVVTYEVEADDIEKAAHVIAVGQSIGNPFLPNHASVHEAHARILQTSGTHGLLQVEFPAENFSSSIAHLLCVLLGGQCDIDLIRRCVVQALDLGAVALKYPRPIHGISGLGRLLHVPERPLFGTILKPKQGFTMQELQMMVEARMKAGFDVIKEDEVLTDTPQLPLEARTNMVSHLKRLSGWPGIYLSATHRLSDADIVEHAGGSGLHMNVWAGFQEFLNTRWATSLPLYFQRSGFQVWTRGPFALSDTVFYQLVNLCGADMAQVGMTGSYLNEPVAVLKARIAAMRTTMPAFSCGLEPRHVRPLVETFGNDILLMSGGFVAAHPQGVTVALRELKRALE